MYILPKSQYKAIARATLSEYLLPYHRFIKRCIFLTRLPILRRNRIWLWSYQNHLAKTLTKMEGAIEKGRQEVNRLKQERDAAPDSEEKDRVTKRIRRILDQLEVNQRIRLAIKGVCDGIAWRVLRYDRSVIRVLSEADTPGHLEEGTAGGEAERHVHYFIAERLKHVSIRNDLTNYLRIGDITEVDYPEVLLHEVKARNGRVRIQNAYNTDKANQPSKQVRRMIEAQSMINKRQITTPQGTADFIESGVPFQTYLPKVKRLMRRAQKQGQVCVMLEDCLSVQCRNWKKTMEIAQKEKRKVWEEEKRCDDWEKADRIIAHSNYDTFSHHEGQFLRNVVPYAVFPLPAKMCTDLLLGNILVLTKLNLRLLGKRFEQAGWSVDIPDLAHHPAATRVDPKNFFSGHLFEHGVEEKIMTISRPPFHLELPYNWLSRLTMEFVTVDTLIRAVDDFHRTAERGKPRMFSDMFKAEHRYWR